jgi:hypothetical protein
VYALVCVCVEREGGEGLHAHVSKDVCVSKVLAGRLMSLCLVGVVYGESSIH